MVKKSRKEIFSTLKKIIENWYIIPLVYYGLIRKKHYVLKLKNGLTIKMRTKSTDLQAIANVFALEEYQQPGFEINQDDIIIDVGSHIGLFALYASKKCKDGKIFCYEPINENYQLLIENVKNNNIKNIFYYNFAVSDNQEKIKIYLNDDDAGHSIIKTTQKFQMVESISLKKIFDENKINKCNFLKLDCEGAEFKILESLPNEYFNRINKIVLEYHIFNNDFESLEKMKSRLKKLNYNILEKKYSKELGLLYANFEN